MMGPHHDEAGPLDTGGNLPTGLAFAYNGTDKPERLLPIAVLECPWPKGHHSTRCDWRLHVEHDEARKAAGL